MKKDEKVYYFIGQDNIASLKGMHNQNIFKGNYKFKFSGETTINFDNNLLSNEKNILIDNAMSSLKAHIVFYDLFRNKPYFENLNIELYSQVNRKNDEIRRLQLENNQMRKLLFNLKGTDTAREAMFDFLDDAGKARAKIYQYSSEFGGGLGLDSGLYGRYGMGRTIMPEQIGEQ